MNLQERQAAITRICFDRTPSESDLERVGSRQRWLMYRHMVRTRLADMIGVGFGRTRSSMGVQDFDELVSSYFATHGPQTRYIRNVVLEFYRFARKWWEEHPAAAAWIPELATYEASRWELAHGEFSEPAPFRDFDFQGMPVFVNTVRLLKSTHAVHLEPKDGEYLEQESEILLYRRRDNHKVGYRPLTPLRADLVRAWLEGDTTVIEACQKVTKEHGVQIDEAFVNDLGSFCADLIERTILLGSADS